MEFLEKMQDLINRISMNLVDLEEKDNHELAIILKDIDILFRYLSPVGIVTLENQIKIISSGIESLILREIDPIDDLINFINTIYDNFGNLQSMIFSLEQNKRFSSENLEKVNESGKNLLEKEEDKEIFIDQVDSELFNDFISESKEYVDSLEVNIIELEKNPTNVKIINEIFRPFHTLKGVSSFMGLKKLNTISHETENILDQARNNKLVITSQIITVIFQAIDMIKRIIMHINAEDREEKVSDNDLNNLLGLLKSALIQDYNQQVIIELDKKIESRESKKEESIIDTEVEISKKTDDSIRIKTEKLDFLIDMVGELVITFNLIREDKNILQIYDHDFIKKISQLYRVVSELQKASMSLRMIPIGTTFSKMKRVVRDYISKSEKEINLVLIGEETEIDRNIVDSLYDPLVHMIRNSCDHGIEDPETRKQIGKKSYGTVTLNAYHKGNSLVIDVKDDGKGLDKKAIYQKALEKNLIKKDEILSDDQIYKLIFHAGFSTVETVTKVSGRGVGMDVVQQAIKTLGGQVEILTELGKGSTFRLCMPLTLSIIEGMMVNVSDQLYIIPIANIQRSLKPGVNQINSVMGKGETVNISGKLIPIVRLHRKFRLNGEIQELYNSLLIVIQTGNHEFALAVDRLLGIQNVVVKSLGEKFKDLEGVSGATILGDGRVGLILDVNELYHEG